VSSLTKPGGPLHPATARASLLEALSELQKASAYAWNVAMAAEMVARSSGDADRVEHAKEVVADLHDLDRRVDESVDWIERTIGALIPAD
jgi:hypothetical protein